MHGEEKNIWYWADTSPIVIVAYPQPETELLLIINVRFQSLGTENESINATTPKYKFFSRNETLGVSDYYYTGTRKIWLLLAHVVYTGNMKISFLNEKVSRLLVQGFVN